MKQISFEDIGQVIATFEDGGVTAGQVVKVVGNGKVGPCEAGDSFCGVALAGRAGGVGVQLKGFAQVKTTGEVTTGWSKLAADGQGGVQKTEQDSQSYLVVEVDDTQGTAVLYL
jgi:hypothetical protein